MRRLLRRRRRFKKRPVSRVAPEVAFIQSDEFLRSAEWARVRYDALKASNGRCELCGRGKHDGVALNADHIKCRRDYPQLALDITNIQILCGDAQGCNRGKGNRDATDWRHPSHPHRR